jgi:F-type H+-transporting ATPase subunit b
MTIDWITVSAQIINFLLLVWLLKRFLYRPVLRAMARREERILQRLHEAQEREEQAEERREHYRQRRDELDRQHDQLLQHSREEAERERRALLDTAREEVAAQRAQWQQQLQQEKEEFLANLRRQTLEAVQGLARKALADLADAQLEEQIANQFITRLRGLDSPSRKALAATEQPLRINTAFELDPATKGRLTRALHDQIRAGIEVAYEQVPQLQCGIELNSDQQRLSWNLADYLEEMETRIDTVFTPAETPKGRE